MKGVAAERDKLDTVLALLGARTLPSQNANRSSSRDAATKECQMPARVFLTHHVTLQLSPRSFFSHLKMRSLLPEGGTDARNAAPARGGKLPGTGALLPLPPLLLLLLSAVFNRYLYISTKAGGEC